MSVAIVACRAQLGLHARLVHVEVSLSSGLPVFGIVGLPATVVKESKDRVRAALVHSNFEFPAGRITVNLSPADIPKRGGRFDLPIALGILLASGQIELDPTLARDLVELEFYGELGHLELDSRGDPRIRPDPASYRPESPAVSFARSQARDLLDLSMPFLRHSAQYRCVNFPLKRHVLA